MKYSLLFSLLLCFTSTLFAQKSERIIHANTDKTYFLEGKKDVKHNWWLDPQLSLDVYQTDKMSRPTWVSFHTDIESFRIKMKPGESYDFTVILNEKDTCRNRIIATPPITKYANLQPATHDTIPFFLTEQNNIVFKVVLNEQDTLDLFFDTGATDIVLKHEAIAEKTHLLEDKEEGYKTQTFVPLDKRYSIQIGDLTWENNVIYPIPVNPKETDGHFGWDLFDGRIVELDYDKSLMIIHSSLPKKPKGYAKLDLEYINGLFCIQGKIKVNDEVYIDRYLFDTGYQRAVLLDSVLRKKVNFPEDLEPIKVTTLRNSAGTVFETKIINSDRLNFKKATAENIPTQLLNLPNPAQFDTHILGNELLKRFNTILDFQNDCVYLKANSLMDLPYTDAS